VDEKPQKWDWTLGKTQYDWLKKTLETSNAAHKFVFAHHNRGQGRGGAIPATGFELGDMDGNQYKFDEFRPGWGLPIHQFMVTNGVNIFFQGHDHLFALEIMDGLVYQEVPMPSDTSYQIGVLANADAYTDLTLDGSGHLRVTVEQDCTTVDYVAAYLPEDTLGAHKNREIRYSYKVGNCAVPTEDQPNTARPFFITTPNPTTGNLTLKTSEAVSTERKIEVFDLQGSLVREAIMAAGETSVLMYLSGLVSGIFVIQLAGLEGVFAQKIMVH
jgi:Secretion system C-terminal sorting domain